MAASSEFFEQRSAPAVLKHGILARYAYYFEGRAGSATGGRVALIDGYAGAGRYEDGTEGSPLLLATQAKRAELFGRDVKLALVEQDARRRSRLEMNLRDAEITVDQLLDGTLEASIEMLLDRYEGRAIFLFVDPFGLGLSREMLERVLSRRSRTQPIDILYHFSVSTLARMGRAALGGHTSELNAEKIGAALGVIPWRREFEDASRSGEPTAAAIKAASYFGQSVCEATGMRCTSIPVRQQLGQLPKYLLMLFSGDAKAHWDFADKASKAYVEWLHFCDLADYQANLVKSETNRGIELFPPTEPTRKDIEKNLGWEAEKYLKERILRISNKDGFRPIDAVEEVYGDMLGRAGAKHVRTALKALYEDGSIDDNGVGEFWNRTIRATNS